MNAIPAKVAGVSEVIMVTPTPHGQRNAMVLAAAAIAGVDRCFAIGGAQAVGALAYGTETVPAVDKIVGPGNAYVAAAKRRVFGTVGIDMIAGPSEILIICDGKTPTGSPWICFHRQNTTSWLRQSCFARMSTILTPLRLQSRVCCPPCHALTLFARVCAIVAL
jgi:hypothetical protein